jgi:hypothetical protein
MRKSRFTESQVRGSEAPFSIAGVARLLVISDVLVISSRPKEW